MLVLRENLQPGISMITKHRNEITWNRWRSLKKKWHRTTGWSTYELTNANQAEFGWDEFGVEKWFLIRDIGHRVSLWMNGQWGKTSSWCERERAANLTLYGMNQKGCLSTWTNRSGSSLFQCGYLWVIDTDNWRQMTLACMPRTRFFAHPHLDV